jgi:hypothetical protein
MEFDRFMSRSDIVVNTLLGILLLLVFFVCFTAISLVFVFGLLVRSSHVSGLGPASRCFRLRRLDTLVSMVRHSRFTGKALEKCVLIFR